MKVGIFGGSFNPPHLGHLNSLQEVLTKTGLEKIFVVPAAQNPLKTPVEGPLPQQRFEMTKVAVENWGDHFEIDPQEIQRGAPSYTIETILNYRKSFEAEDLYLILGLDKFEEIGLWKDYKEVLKNTNLIITTRPGLYFPETKEELPAFLLPLVSEFDFNYIELTNGRNIQFVKIKEFKISSTEVRKGLRLGKSVSSQLPISVENYIREHRLYLPFKEKVSDFSHFTEFCANILFSKKGIYVKGFDLRKMSAPSEFTVLASGTSTRHTSALAEQVIQGVKEEYNLLPQGVEGLDEGRWVLIDYGSLIVHLFYDYVRTEYSLETLWKDAIDLKLKDPFVK